MFAETLEDFALKHSDLIVQSAMNGNERAFSQLMNIWYKRIYNFSYKYFGDHDLAMEATQRTFISVHKAVKGLKETSSFTSWIFRIALNNCHEEERKSKKRSWLSIFNKEKDDDDKLMPLHHHTDDEFYNPDSAVELKEMQAIITNCLREIPAEQRTVVILKEYEGLKFREIAMALEISESTAKSRLYYGLNAMRKQLEHRNIYKENAYGN